jgi:hypothetical protein
MPLVHFLRVTSVSTISGVEPVHAVVTGIGLVLWERPGGSVDPADHRGERAPYDAAELMVSHLDRQDAISQGTVHP